MVNINAKKSEIIKKLLPDSRLGIIKCILGDNCHSFNIDTHLNSELTKIKNELDKAKENTFPIIAETRRAYKICGKEPSRYRPSAEALLRRIRTGKGLYRINNIVDTINILSFSSHFSIGGFDMEKIVGNAITLDIGNNDPYLAIGRGELNIEFMPGLRDENGFFGTPTSDSMRTMTSPDTKNLLLVYYDFMGNSMLDQALKTAKEILIQNCDASNFKISIC